MTKDDADSTTDDLPFPNAGEPGDDESADQVVSLVDAGLEAELATAKAEAEAAKKDMGAMASALLEAVPESLKGLVPKEMSPGDQVSWFLRNKNLLLRQRVVSTDVRKPSSTPQPNDMRHLPPADRIAKHREMSGRH